MAIVSCPECSKKLKVADAAVGKKVKCSCGNVFLAQTDAGAAPPAKKPAAATAPGLTPEKVYVGCTECGAKLKVATTSLGKKMKCPKCAAVFTANIDEADAAAPSPPKKKAAPPPAEEKPKAKAKPAVSDDDMDDLLNFAQEDAAKTPDDSPFGDMDAEDESPKAKGKAAKKADPDDDAFEDDMPKPKGKAKKADPDDDEDEDDDPKAKSKSKGKPGKPPPRGKDDEDEDAADKKPVYPRRTLLNVFVFVLLALYLGLFASVFLDVLKGEHLGIPKPKAPAPALVGKGKDNGPNQKAKDAEKLEAENKQEAAKLDGVWIVTSAEMPGVSLDAMKGTKFAFADGKVTTPDGVEAPFSVDASKDPKWINLPTPAKLMAQGIYQLDGDTLQWCTAIPQKKKLPAGKEGMVPGPRPKKFDAAEGVLVVLKKQSDTTDPPEPLYSRTQSADNLKNIGLAIHGYYDSNKRLPSALTDPAGKPLLSWRVAILPHLDEGALYKQFDLEQPWDHPTNKKLIAKMPKIFVLPNIAAPEGMTHYRAFSGPVMPFEPGRRLTMAGITDGTSNVIGVVEAKEPTIWTKPDDLEYSAKGPLPKFGVSPQGFNAMFLDGAVRFLPLPMPDDVIRPFFACTSGKTREWRIDDANFIKNWKPALKEKDKDVKDKKVIKEKDKDAADLDKTINKLGGRVVRDDKLPGMPVVEVDFSGAMIADADLKLLAGLKDLRKLRLASTKITGAGLKALGELENLEELDLSFAIAIDDEAVKELAAFKKLKVLSVLNCKVTDAGLKTIAGLDKLEELKAGQNKLTDAGVTALGNLKELRRLELGNTGTGDEALKAIGQLDKLEALILFGTSISDNGMKDVGKLKKLQLLRLSFNVSDKGLQELAGLSELRDLNLVFSKVKDDGMKVVGGFKKLEKLDISFLDVSDVGIKELAGLDKMQWLELNQTKVTDASLKQLAQMKELQTLSLRDTKVTAEAVAELKKSLPKCQVFHK